MTYQKRAAVMLALFSILILFISACGGSPASLEPTGAAAVEELAGAAEQAADVVEAAEPEHEVHWSYEGEGGPEHWGEIDAEKNVACATGQRQSPIDISGANAADLTNIVFNYQPTAVKIFNNGHTIQVKYDAGSFIEVEGVRYNLDQFHFHSPSEHAINGVLADAEMHLVHKLSDTELAVVGLLIYSGAENPAFTPVWDNLPTEVTTAEQSVEGAMFNAADVIPEGSSYYTYPGSLTTPPCSETVTWLVLTTPVEMSAEQIEAFRAIIEGNNRPLQPLNGREVVEDSTAD